MDCTFEQTRFLVHCSLLGILIISCFIFLIIYIIATIIIIRNSQVWQTKEDLSDDMKTCSNTPLIFSNRKPRSLKPEVAPNEFRDNSLVRKKFDRIALDVIYGADYEIESVSSEKGKLGSPSRGRVAERAVIFENPSVATPTQQLDIKDATKRRTNELSKKFRDDPNVPTGLLLKPGKPEGNKEDELTDIPAEPPKPKKPVRKYKDPPSVFKGRHQREEFLDVEFVELVEQTNKRLAEYTLAGVEETDVQIFANQHLTEKNIKRSKLEFDKTTLQSEGKQIPIRKISDQKSMLLTAKSVLDDIDFELTVKKNASLESMLSGRTQVTNMSQDDLRP